MKLIKKILVPVDFSGHALNVVAKAVDVARYTHAQLVFLHVYHRPLISKALESKLGPDEIAYLEKIKRDHQQQYIKDQFRRLFEAFPGLKEMRAKCIKERGLLVEKIIEIDAREEIDLICMGTKGAQGLDVFWGTKTAEICLRLNTPVLVIPRHFKSTKLHKIAFAYDLKSIKDLQSLNLVKLLSMIYDAEVHIVTVRQDAKITEKERSNLERLKKCFAEFLPVIHVSKAKDVEKGIFDYLKKHEITMLVLLQRDRSLLEDIFHERITKRVAYHTKVPVLALDER